MIYSQDLWKSKIFQMSKTPSPVYNLEHFCQKKKSRSLQGGVQNSKKLNIFKYLKHT